MPQFGSPFGGGYGLGQVGAGIEQGLLKGQIEAPQLGYEKLRNQALQTQLTNQQAQQQAMSQEAPEQVPTGADTPYDQPLANLKTQHDALMKSGQGQAAFKLQQDMLQMASQQHAFQLQEAARSVMGGDYTRAKKLLSGAGMNTRDIKADPDNPGGYIITDENGQPMKVNQLQLQGLAENAQNAGQFANAIAMNNYRLGQLGLGQQKLQSIDESRKAQNDLKTRAQTWKEQTFPQLMQNKKDVAGIGAGGRTGAAQISANERNYEFMNQPEHAMIGSLVDSGSTYPDAYQITQIIKEGGKQADPETLAVSMYNHELQSNPAAFPDQAAKDKYLTDKVALIRGLQGAKSKPTAPVIPKGATVIDTTGLPADKQAIVNKMSAAGETTENIQAYIKALRNQLKVPPQVAK